MTISEAYFLMAFFQGIGYLQSSLTELLFFRKYPTILEENILPGMLTSRKATWLAFGNNIPGIWLLMLAKIMAGGLLLFFIFHKNIPFYWPLLMILLDQLGFLRFSLIGRSEAPIQRTVLVALTFHLLLKDETISQAGLVFISLQVGLAYFAAGYHKLKDPKWKKGQAIPLFLARYLNGTWIKPLLLKYQRVLLLSTYAVVLFELSFLIGLIHPDLALTFFCIGITFHLGISITSGINEFLWAFVGCYPAVFVVSHMVNEQLMHWAFK
ncbi:MAG: hypothetical protein ACJAXX_001307 [Roseivirga sp.]|jgi:hypothetical protein